MQGPGLCGSHLQGHGVQRNTLPAATPACLSPRPAPPAPRSSPETLPLPRARGRISGWQGFKSRWDKEGALRKGGLVIRCH